MVKRLSLLLFTYYCFFLCKADFFDDYLNDKTFGVNPGPCPLDDQSCSLNLEADKLPPAIANIEFCITIGVTICDELQDWVKGGLVEVWEVECTDLGVEEIALSEVNSDFNSTSNRFSVTNLIQRCSGKARFTDVRLTSLGIDILVSVNAEFETDPRRDGFSVDFVLVLSAEGGFAENLVDLADVDECGINLELGLSLDNTDFTDLKINLFGDGDGINIPVILFENQIANILVTIIEGILGGAVCGVIEQAGFLNNGDLGVLNVVLNEVNEVYDVISAPVEIDIIQTDAQFSQFPEQFGASVNELEQSVILKDSNLLEFVSTVLNAFLGDPEIQPLRINQAISLLTEPDGFIGIDLKPFEIVQVLPLSFADAVITFEEISFDGLNTIEFFSFLANNFTEEGDGLNFTLTHDFELDEFILLTRINLRLKRGSWVTVSSCGVAPDFEPESICQSDQETFTFDFGLTAKDIEFGLATLTAINFDEIGELQFGQLFDVDLVSDPTSTLTQVLNCAAPSIYALLFSDFKLVIGSLSDPFVNNFSGEGLDALLENGVDLIFTLIQTVLANDLKNIMRGPIRTFVNDFLTANVSDVDDVSLCPPYVQVPSENPYIIFNEGLVDDFFPLLTEILGNFDANSDVDLNDLIQVVLEYYSENAEEFPLESVSLGDWITKSSFIPFISLPAFEFAFVGAEEAYLAFEKLEIQNLDAINEFLIESRDAFPNGVSYTLGFVNDDDFVVSFTFDFKALNLVDDNFVFSIKLRGIDFKLFLDEFLFNVDEFFRLRVNQTEHIPCVLSLIDGIIADADLSKVSAERISFDIEFLSTVENDADKSDLRVALELLQSEFENEASQQQVTRLANYFFGLGFEVGLTSFQSGNYTITPETCDEVESTFGQIFQFFTGITDVNLTYFVEECLDEIEAITPLAQFEQERLGYIESEEEIGDLYYRNENNFFLTSLSSFFSSSANDPTTLNNILIAFANATGNPFVDFLVLEDDNVTVTLEIPLNEDNVLLEFFGLEPFIISDDEGFRVEVQTLRVKGINSFVEKLDIFNILSNFTTSYSVEFSEVEALEAEIIGILEVNATDVALEPIDAPPIREEIVAKANLRGLSFYLELFAAFRSDTFIELSIAHFLTLNEDQEFGFTDFVTTCFLRNFPANGLNIRSFSINVADISEPVVQSTNNNILSEGFESIIEEMSRIFIDFYFPALPNICENCVRQFLNENIEKQLEIASVSNDCPVDAPSQQISEENKFYRYSDSEGLTQFQAFAENILFANDHELFNLIVEGVTAETFFDTNPFDTGIFEFIYFGKSYGSLQFVFEKLRILGLNTFSFVQLFTPKDRSSEDFNNEFDPYRLNLALNYSGPAEFQTRETLIGYDFFLQGPIVRNDLEFDLTLENVEFGIDFLLYFNLNTFMSIQFDQVDSLEEIPCILSPVQGLDILTFVSKVDSVQVVVDCFGICDAPVIKAVTLTGPFVSTDTELVAEVYNDAVEFIIGYLDSANIEDIFSNGLSNLPDTCADIVDTIIETVTQRFETSNTFDVVVYFTIVVSSLFILVVVSCFISGRNKFKTVTKEVEHPLVVEIAHLENSGLIGSSQINLCCRLLLPVICVVNIVLVVIAISSSDSLVVIVQIIFLGMETNVLDLYPLSMSGIVDDSWAGTSYFVSILLGLGVFIWPIIRNLALVFLWTVPASLISLRNRFTLIQLLNLSGKISFVDIFVITVAFAALKTTVDISTQDEFTFLQEDIFGVDVAITPERGLVLMALASFSSLLVSHFMSFYHLVTVDALRKKYDEVSGLAKIIPKKAKQSFNVLNYKFKNGQVNSTRVKYFIYLNIFTMILIVISFFVPLVTFELRGLIGLLVEEIDDTAGIKKYSLFQILQNAAQATTDTFLDQIGVMILVVVFFAITFLAPMLTGILLNILVSAKLSLQSLKTLLYLTVIVASWAALDVAFIGVVVTLFEVDNIASIVINLISRNLCFSAQQAIGVVLPEDDASCLQVGSTLEYAAIPIVAAIVLQLSILFCFLVLSWRVADDWYFYAYVKTGQRIQEGKPPKLDCLSRAVIRFFTIEKEGADLTEYELSDGSYELPDTDDKNPGGSTLNPLFELEEDEEDVNSSSQKGKKKATSPRPPSRLEIKGDDDIMNKFSLVRDRD